MTRYEVTIATTFYKTVVVEAETPAAARSIIYHGEAEHIATIEESVGTERIVGPVRLSQGHLPPSTDTEWSTE